MTRFLRIARIGSEGLKLHPLRSLLTALGIIIGVGTVIYMLAVIEGRGAEIQERIKARGSNNIILRARKPQDDTKASATRSREVVYGLTYEDARRIHDTFKEVDVLVPVRDVASAVYNGDARSDTVTMATVPWYLDVSRGSLQHGRWFTDLEMSDATPVAVLGATLARSLFLWKDPVGASVRIGSKVYAIIGVLEATVTSDERESLKRDRAAYIPLTTVRERFGERNVKTATGSMDIERVELHEIILQVKDAKDVVSISEGVRTMLARFHTNEDYEIDVPLALLEEAQRESNKAKQLFGSIAAISLLVGGIGIMNIMLASVTERTREIGIRRALGARRSDITLQFLVETLILSVAGGIIGIVCGISAAALHEQFVTDSHTMVTAMSVVLAFGISAFVGVLAGLYPAVRASAMDPIEALRHE
ncbi:MAG: ABC transporter permease [Planctomycetes bacterium]|nr:ABC transporter permease [Planctomycetota bacterium]